MSNPDEPTFHFSLRGRELDFVDALHVKMACQTFARLGLPIVLSLDELGQLAFAIDQYNKDCDDWSIAKYGHPIRYGS